MQLIREELLQHDAEQRLLGGDRRASAMVLIRLSSVRVVHGLTFGQHVGLDGSGEMIKLIQQVDTRTVERLPSIPQYLNPPGDGLPSHPGHYMVSTCNHISHGIFFVQGVVSSNSI